MSDFLGLRVKEKQKPFSLLDFLIQWGARVGGALVLLHEGGHVVGAALIGLYAEYRSTNLAAVYPDASALPLPFVKHVIFYGMGGFLQCVLFLIFNIRNNDRENRMVNGMVAVHGIIYAVFEAGFSKSTWGLGGLLGSFAGFFMFFLFLVWRKPEIIA